MALNSLKMVAEISSLKCSIKMNLESSEGLGVENTCKSDVSGRRAHLPLDQISSHSFVSTVTDISEHRNKKTG